MKKDLRLRLKLLMLRLVDSVERRLKIDDPLVPPKSLSYLYGAGGFLSTSLEFFKYFIHDCGLRVCDRVLDVGCGTGRMALPLTSFLGEEGRYDGFDIIEDGLRHCTDRIAARFPGFQFQLVDVFNSFYNPKGTIQASQFRFPFENERFDLVFSTSVFTHLLPKDARHYVGQISRVLKPGRRSLNTFFLWNEEAKRALRTDKRAARHFAHQWDGCRVENPAVPEDAVAHEEAVVRQWHAESGLRIVEPIKFGRWSGREDGVSLQDIVIAEKQS